MFFALQSSFQIMPREKTFRRIITFHTTTEAVAFEKYCLEKSIPGRLIPLPGEISAGCGMCWMVPLENSGDADRLADSGELRHEGVFTLLM